MMSRKKGRRWNSLPQHGKVSETLQLDVYTMFRLSDPTQIDWGTEKEEPQAPPPVVTSSTAAGVQTFKCTALYSYTVSK